MTTNSALQSTELLDAISSESDIATWINDNLLLLPHSQDALSDLAEVDKRVNHLIASLGVIAQDTAFQLEGLIENITRGVPRLTYDLHFMKDGVLSLQSVLAQACHSSQNHVLHDMSTALDHLHHLDAIKTHMEAAKNVLQEAESWSTLESEISSLLAEQNYARAALRLSEASRSMVVFENTTEYEPRRTLMTVLQNQMEASLSSALVAAINAQDVTACRHFFSIFSNIQRESEFRNYYNGSRRAAILKVWQDAQLAASSSVAQPSDTFVAFLSVFYTQFLALLKHESILVTSIFPDPAETLSTFFASILAALQPTFSQRLASVVQIRGPNAYEEIIKSFIYTEEFAISADKIFEEVKRLHDASLNSSLVSSDDTTRRRNFPQRQHSRSNQSTATPVYTATSSGWSQDLFRPFLVYQADFSSLEERLLEKSLAKMATARIKDAANSPELARTLRDTSTDIFLSAEGSLFRCSSFTHGYGVVGLVHAVDIFISSFIQLWTPKLTPESYSHLAIAIPSGSSAALSDLDYTPEDLSSIQSCLHLLAAARTVFDKLLTFEIKLRTYLADLGVAFHTDIGDASKLKIPYGEWQLLTQSPLNSAELHRLLKLASQESITLLTGIRDPSFLTLLLSKSRVAIVDFSRSCQGLLQNIMLSPLRNHLISYPSISIWSSSENRTFDIRQSANDLRIPDFSLSPTPTIQRVAEGLLNLPRLFEAYEEDNSLSFSLGTLPYVDLESLKAMSEPLADTTAGIQPSHTHIRRSSIASKTEASQLTPEAVSSAWLTSLGYSMLVHLESVVLPNISSLSVSGCTQLSVDLAYLANIVRALNVDGGILERWKELVDLEDVEGVKRVKQSEDDSVKMIEDEILRHVARMRGWTPLS